MRIAYADPPYPGCAHLYRKHPDFAGEVDYLALVMELETKYDGWILHTHINGYRQLERARVLPVQGIRILQWIKPFAAFKRNVKIAYAYEPIIIKPVREPEVPSAEISRDWLEEAAIKESITMQKGLAGAKPARVCCWLFQLMGMIPEDQLVDLFPGTGAVTRAWHQWREAELNSKTHQSNEYMVK